MSELENVLKKGTPSEKKDALYELRSNLEVLFTHLQTKLQIGKRGVLPHFFLPCWETRTMSTFIGHYMTSIPFQFAGRK